MRVAPRLRAGDLPARGRAAHPVGPARGGERPRHGRPARRAQPGAPGHRRNALFAVLAYVLTPRCAPPTSTASSAPRSDPAARLQPRGGVSRERHRPGGSGASGSCSSTSARSRSAALGAHPRAHQGVLRRRGPGGRTRRRGGRELGPRPARGSRQPDRRRARSSSGRPASSRSCWRTRSTPARAASASTSRPAASSSCASPTTAPGWIGRTRAWPCSATPPASSDALDDLAAIRSFGFRGEALPSIASVSRFELRTRRSGDAEGTLVRVEGGGGPVVAPAGCAAGTVVEVRELFFNVPGAPQVPQVDRHRVGQRDARSSRPPRWASRA